MKKQILAALVAMPFWGFSQVPWDTQSDTWVAVDELNREVANSDVADISAFRNDGSQIGVFYYLWHGQHTECGKDNTKLLAANPENPDWGPELTYHWWGKPVLGYYRGGDSYIVAKHMQMLADAGADFIFLDCTNAVIYENNVRAVMREMDRREALGLRTMKICFMVHSNEQNTAERIYKEFYQDPSNDKYWYFYDGKPLLLGNKAEIGKTKVEGLMDRFTFRNSWAWMNGQKPDEWSWLEYYPQKPGWTDSSAGKKVEQISVSVAQHAHTKVGKSYHNGHQPAIDRYGLCKETPQGLYFEEQWKEAHRVHPPVVMITQFNEWIAMRFIVKQASEVYGTRPGATPRIGESYFIDAYNSEFNRDVEPSWNADIRDNYYLQMCSNIRRYKGVHNIPVPTAMSTIAINDDFSQWDNAGVEFKDDKGDILNASQAGVQSEGVTDRKTNDIVRAKTTHDGENYYFMVETDANISRIAFSKFWMKLLLNTDTDYNTGWNGYDYMVCKDPETKKYTLMRNQLGIYRWKAVGEAEYKVVGKQLHLKIPFANLKLSSPRDIDFKWADNITDDKPDILTFITDGDVAPNGRFNYRYKASALHSGLSTVSGGDAPVRVVKGGVVVASPAVSVEVYNLQGNVVGRYDARTNGEFIGLVHGCYVLKAVSGRYSYVERICV